jgi:flagellar hook-length control protein FliK
VKTGAVPAPSSSTDTSELADVSPLAGLSLDEVTQQAPVSPAATASAVTRQASAKASAAAANAQQQAVQELADAANGEEASPSQAAGDTGARSAVRQEAPSTPAPQPGAAPQAGGNMVLQQMIAQASAAAKAAPGTAAGAAGQTGTGTVAATQARGPAGAANLALMAQAALQAAHAAPPAQPAATTDAAADTAGMMALDGGEEGDLAATEDTASSDQDFSSEGSGTGSSSQLAAGLGDVRSSGDGSFARAVQQASAAPGSSRQMLSPAAQQLAIHVQRAVANNNSVLSVQLNPREMGMIDIHVQMQDGNLRARVTVEKQSTLDQFQKDAAGLQKALADAGLSIDSNSLQFDLSGQNQGQAAADARDQQQFRSSPGRRAASAVGGVDSAATVTQATLYVEEGRVDLKV